MDYLSSYLQTSFVEIIAVLAVVLVVFYNLFRLKNKRDQEEIA